MSTSVQYTYTMSTSEQYTYTMSTRVQYTYTMSSSVQYTYTMSTSVQYTCTMSTSVQFTYTMSTSEQYTYTMSTSVPVPLSKKTLFFHQRKKIHDKKHEPLRYPDLSGSTSKKTLSFMSVFPQLSGKHSLSLRFRISNITLNQEGNPIAACSAAFEL